MKRVQIFWGFTDFKVSRLKEILSFTNKSSGGRIFYWFNPFRQFLRTYLVQCYQSIDILIKHFPEFWKINTFSCKAEQIGFKVSFTLCHHDFLFLKKSPN